MLFRPDQKDSDGATGSSEAPPPVYLKLESSWVVRCGIQNDINRGIVNQIEFNKIKDNLDLTGTIEFWWSELPPDLLPEDEEEEDDFDPTDEEEEEPAPVPDWSMAGIKLVSVIPVRAGEIKDVGGPNVEYCLVFSDCRWRLQRPRGGRLTLGLVNPSNEEKGRQIDEPQPPQEKTVNELLEAAATATGADIELASGNLVPDTFKPPQNLKWYGAHAASELGKLLEYSGCVIFPLRNGKLKIDVQGSGDEPNPPADRLVASPSFKGLSNAGKTVIYVSTPTQVVNTTYFPASQLIPVCQDADGAFKRLANVAALSAGPIAVLNDMEKINDPDARKRIDAQLYRAFALDPEKYDARHNRILSKVIDIDGSLVDPIAKGVYAVRDHDGIWANREGDNPLDTQFGTRNIIGLSDRMILVKGPDGANDRDRAAMSAATDWTIRLTIEEAIKAADGGKKPEYFAVGYRKEIGQADPLKLTDQELQEELDNPGPDTFFIDRPDWRLRRYDGQDQNRQELEALALADAKIRLKGSETTSKVKLVKGWWGEELSGRLAEIQLSQERPILTTLKIDTWFLPFEALRSTQRIGTREAFPGQLDTRGEATALGSTDATQHSSKAQMTPAVKSPVIELGKVEEIPECTNTLVVKPSLPGDERLVDCKLVSPLSAKVPVKSFEVGDEVAYIRYGTLSAMILGYTAKLPVLSDGTVGQGGAINDRTTISRGMDVLYFSNTILDRKHFDLVGGRGTLCEAREVGIEWRGNRVSIYNAGDLEFDGVAKWNFFSTFYEPAHSDLEVYFNSSTFDEQYTSRIVTEKDDDGNVIPRKHKFNVRAKVPVNGDSWIKIEGNNWSHNPIGDRETSPLTPTIETYWVGCELKIKIPALDVDSTGHVKGWSTTEFAEGTVTFGTAEIQDQNVTGGSVSNCVVTLAGTTSPKTVLICGGA